MFIGITIADMKEMAKISPKLNARSVVTRIIKKGSTKINSDNIDKGKNMPKKITVAITMYEGIANTRLKLFNL